MTPCGIFVPNKPAPQGILFCGLFVPILLAQWLWIAYVENVAEGQYLNSFKEVIKDDAKYILHFNYD
jgi:hypothetical protein